MKKRPKSQLTKVLKPLYKGNTKLLVLCWVSSLILYILWLEPKETLKILVWYAWWWAFLHIVVNIFKI